MDYLKPVEDLAISINDVVTQNHFFTNCTIVICVSMLLFLSVLLINTLKYYQILDEFTLKLLAGVLFVVSGFIILPFLVDGVISIVKKGKLDSLKTIGKRFGKRLIQSCVLIAVTLGLIVILFVPALMLTTYLTISIEDINVKSIIQVLFAFWCLFVVSPIIFAALKELLDTECDLRRFLKEHNFIKVLRKNYLNIFMYSIYFLLLSSMFVFEIIICALAVNYSPNLALIAWPAVVEIVYFLWLLEADYVFRKCFS